MYLLKGGTPFIFWKGWFLTTAKHDPEGSAGQAGDKSHSVCDGSWGRSQSGGPALAKTQLQSDLGCVFSCVISDQ